jgi:hypothetical protein
MNNKTKILVYVDQKRRDLYPMEKIKDALQNTGDYAVRLSGKADFLFSVMFFKPQIIIYGKNDGYHGDWLRAISGSIVISINTEQGYTDANETYINFMEGHKYLRAPEHESVDYHFLISEITKQHLIPYLDEKKLKVVGYTRLMQDEFATKSKPCKKRFVIGIAAGEDIGDKYNIQSSFTSYLDKPFGYLDNVQGFLAFHLLDRCWLNHICETLKKKYDVVVRYRFNDKDYMFNEDGIRIDMSDSPINFFNDCDLVIMGQSTIGVEAMMYGIPVISITKLINPGFSFTKVVDFPYINICWQPESFDELLQMIELRKDENLDLSPRYDDYVSFVSNTYYNGQKKDSCMGSIVDFISKLELKNEAYLDLSVLFSLISVPCLQKMKMKYFQKFNNIITYNMMILIPIFKSKIKKSTYQEIYMPKVSLFRR